MSKVMGIFVQFWPFYDACLPNTVMSRDSRSKFQKNFYFVLILHLILEIVTKFLVEKLSTSEVISKNPTGGGKHPPPVPLGLKFRDRNAQHFLESSKFC